jgi:hypothetical protein
MERVEVIGLQEVHGTREDMDEYFKAFPCWIAFPSPAHSPAAGGVALLINKCIIDRARDVLYQVLWPGRGVRVQMQFYNFTLNMLCLHVEPAATRLRQQNFLQQALSTAEDRVAATFILADLNACLPGDHRIRLQGLQDPGSDDVLGSWFSHKYPGLTIAEHDGFTRLGRRDGAPSILSRIDYILTDMAKPTLLDCRFTGYTLGDLFKHTCSDHIAVIASLHPPRDAPPDRRIIPSWISTSDYFKATVTALISQHRSITDDPLNKTDLMEIFQVAAQRYRDRPPAEALCASAKLHWSLVAFRSLRGGSAAGLRRALRAYPDLKVDTLEHDIGELTIAVADLQFQSHNDRTDKRRGEAAGAAYMAKIALWRKHTSRSKFFHIKDDQGLNITADDGMAKHISDHWKGVFQARSGCPHHDTNMNILLDYVPEAVGVCNDPFDEDDITLSLRRHDTAPGPDGVCYSAWKAAGNDGIKVLHDIAMHMWNGAPAPESFRQSLMVFLPKSDAVALSPSELRPLSLCDVDYKIIMGCINHRLAMLLPDFVDDRQRGFMRQRLGLDNLLLLEAASMIAARSGASSPALCFLDIAAAFPSMLHDYMIKVVYSFLGQHPLANMIASMYANNRCEIIVRGSTYPGFRIFCGVRQGCPLSGTLFALCFHPIILHMSDMMYRHSMNISFHIFAYADDLACILFEFWRQLQPFAQCLLLVASAAGLHINWRKVQLVPLYRDPDLELFRRRLSATRPAWAAATVALTAKYLGIIIGPAVTDKMAIEDPFGKYIERCRFISRLGLGWVRAAAMHNIFALPVLSYVAQVQADRGIEDRDLDRAAAILFKNPMFRPPYNYFVNLAQLGVQLGLRDVRLECQAAFARTALTLTTLPLARRTMTQGSDDDHLRLHPLRAWQNRSATVTLGAQLDSLRAAVPEGFQPPYIQRQCRQLLKKHLEPYDYRQIIAARMGTVLRRNGVDDVSIHHDIANDIVRTIILAATNLHCTELSAFLRLAQNGLLLGVHGDSLQPCPLCGAPAAARLSHALNCGALWVFVCEECPGLGWDCSSHDRWRLLVGARATDNDSSAMLCLLWDALHAGFNAGRFGREGVASCMSRLIALTARPGYAGRMARAMTQPPPLHVT